MKVIIAGDCPHYDVFRRYMNQLLYGEDELYLLHNPNPQSNKLLTWINQWVLNQKRCTIRLLFHSVAYTSSKEMHKDMISQSDAIIVFGEKHGKELLDMARKNKLKKKVVKL